MPEKKTVERAKEDLKEGKSPSTAAGEFVHQEIEHVREGKHGARSPEQAIAIGLSKARRAGVPLPRRSRGRPSNRLGSMPRGITRGEERGRRKRPQPSALDRASRR
jgi:hypothetical protein